MTNKNKAIYVLTVTAPLFFLAILLMPQLVFADTITFTNPFEFTTVEAFLGSFLGYVQGIIVTLSIIFIVIGGIMYIFAGVDEGMVKKGKTAITAAMIGLAIGVAAPSFLKEIAAIVGWDGEVSEDALTLSEIAMNTLNFLLSIVGVLSMLMLVIGGFTYFTAAGEEKKADDAKGIIKYAIMGLVVSLLALVIVKQIALLFVAS